MQRDFLKRKVKIKMNVFSIDDDRGTRELVKSLFAKTGDTVHSFENPFEMYIALQDEVPDVIIVDYDYRAYRLPKGAFECLGKLRSKVVLMSGYDWKFICQDLDRRNINLPNNIEFIRKGSLNMLTKLNSLSRVTA